MQNLGVARPLHVVRPRLLTRIMQLRQSFTLHAAVYFASTTPQDDLDSSFFFAMILLRTCICLLHLRQIITCLSIIKLCSALWTFAGKAQFHDAMGPCSSGTLGVMSARHEFICESDEMLSETGSAHLTHDTKAESPRHVGQLNSPVCPDSDHYLLKWSFQTLGGWSSFVARNFANMLLASPSSVVCRQGSNLRQPWVWPCTETIITFI